MPPLVHLRTYQVRPFLAPLLHTKKKKSLKEKKTLNVQKKKNERGVAFLCMQKKGGKKKKGAVGTKVDNVHEFVKKINNAASVG